MTFKVNIENGTSFYTTDELISYGLSGCLYAGETELTFLVEQIVAHYEDKLEQASGSGYIDDAEEEGYQRGRSDAISEMMGCLENL